MTAEFDIVTNTIAGDWTEDDVAMAERAARAALETGQAPAESELSLALADDATVQSLNRDYRQKDSPTNVLSFPADVPPMADVPQLLGDVILAFETCRREADEAKRPFANHLAHLTVHGVLHLLGHDHMEPEDATEMEALEVEILSELGIPDPYSDTEPA